MTKKTTKNQCAMCGAVETKPHHDPMCGGVVVALAVHKCQLRHYCRFHGDMLCQPCLEGAQENELEKSGTPEGLLAKAARLQSEYWDALRELELALGDIEIDGSEDLAGATVEELKEEYQ